MLAMGKKVNIKIGTIVEVMSKTLVVARTKDANKYYLVLEKGTKLLIEDNINVEIIYPQKIRIKDNGYW